MLKRFALPLLAVVVCGTFAVGDDLGTIVFYRPKHEAGKPSLFCDGIRLARLPGESIFSVQAAAGRHVCTLERVGNTKEAVAVEVAAGSVSYLQVSQRFGYHMRAAAASEATNVAAMLRPIDTSLVFQTRLCANSHPNGTGGAVATAGAPSIPAAGDIKIVTDAPLATTYYYPEKTTVVRDGLIFWRVYPYVERKGDGSAYFHLRLSLYPPNDDSWTIQDARFTADGRDDLVLDVRYVKATTTNWPLGSISYDFEGPELVSCHRNK